MSSFQPSTPSHRGSPQPKRVKTFDLNEKVGVHPDDDTEGPRTPGATIETANQASTQLDRLTLVTFNVAACQPSAMAIHSWTTDDSLQAIREEVILEQPDIIALQEFPEFALYRTSRIFPDHELLGSRTSHAPYVTLFVRKGIQAKLVPVHADINVHLPAVVAELSYPSEGGDNDEVGRRRRLWIASVHLEPFADGAEVRHQQVQSLLQLALRSKVPLVLAGDFNMRVTEDATMEGEGYDLLDFWKEAGSDFTTKYSWNTRNEINKGGYFNQYYGTRTREYIARYDRIYYHGSVLDIRNDGQQPSQVDSKSDLTNIPSIPSITVESFKLIANRPVGSSKYHFLSDHFGISSTFNLQWAAD